MIDYLSPFRRQEEQTNGRAQMPMAAQAPQPEDRNTGFVPPNQLINPQLGVPGPEDPRMPGGMPIPQPRPNPGEDSANPNATRSVQQPNGLVYLYSNNPNGSLGPVLKILSPPR